MSGDPRVARRAYAQAGVDVDAGDRAVALLRRRLTEHAALDLLGGLRGFAAAVPVPEGYRAPVLVTATDGVGTKTAIARELRRFDTIGQDLVAMCVDDVVCHGARPLLFLDYVAVGRVEPSDVADLVAGMAHGCELAGCALVGGETAEHPGLMEPDAFDLAGFCIGVAERDELLDGRAAEPGDVLIGLGASGLHANGYSLVRAVVTENTLRLDAPYQEILGAHLPEAARDGTAGREPSRLLATLGQVLLTPTRIHAPEVLALRDDLGERGLALRGAAHVTGGGLPGNVPRALPEHLGARLHPDAWPVPSEMRLIAALARLEPFEMRATFNGGLGMVLVVPPAAVGPALASLAGRGVDAWLVGEVVPVDELGGRRYTESE